MYFHICFPNTSQYIYITHLIITEIYLICIGLGVMITVFINGVPTEVESGPVNMKAMFGEDNLMLVHSSGVALPLDEFGVLVPGLQHGESYFLVSKLC